MHEVTIAKNLIKEEALILFSDLKENGIQPFMIEKVENGLTIFEIQIHVSDKGLYDSCYNQRGNSMSIPNLDSHSYMDDFEDYELIDIMNNRNSYNQQMTRKAAFLIDERGIEYDDDKYFNGLYDKILSLKRGIEVSNKEIKLAYLKALFGGFTGIMTGWSWYNTEIKGPDNVVYQKYSRNTRTHGFRIMFLGIFIFALISLAVILYRLSFFN